MAVPSPPADHVDPMDQGSIDVALLVGAVVLLVAIVAVRLSAYIGVPGLLLYLGIGMALGTNGLGLDFDNYRLARNFGLIALALIVAEGGLTARWADIRPAMPAAVSLATLGIAVSVAVTAVAAHLVLSVSWRVGLLLGAVVSATDAAAVFSTLRTLRLPRRAVRILEVESAVNDAPVVVLVTLLADPHLGGFWPGVGKLGYELAAGGAIGAVVGLVAAWSLARIALPAAGLYPIATLAFAVLSYAAAAAVDSSGFLAVYLTSLQLGSAQLPHRRSTLGFVEGVAWLAQIGLFVMLGLLVTPDRLGSHLLPAIALGFVLLLIARPLSVVASLSPFRVPLREQAFLSWAGLRGAVPIVLTTIPFTTGLPQAALVFDTVFVLVVVFTLIQAPLLGPLARVLGLEVTEHARALSVEAAPLDELHADLLQTTISARSRLHNVEVWELRLPSDAAVTLIVRDGHAFVPDRHTVLRRGDELLIVTTRADRRATEQRLQLVSRGGRLARFTGGTS